MRKRVYIATPISKGVLYRNIRRADEAFFALLHAGFAPFNPVWSAFAGRVTTGPLGVYAVANRLPHGTTHADWMGVDLPWVAVADAVLRLPGDSVGADMETSQAKALGIPVFGSVEEVIQWGMSC